MFKENNKFEKFESKVWLASPCMHGPEMTYVKDAYDTNWMSTVGANINEVEKIAAEKAQLANHFCDLREKGLRAE